MGFVLKFALIAIFLFGGCYLGYRLYKVINTRLKESDSGWMILANALLLFITLAGLSALVIFLLVYTYDFLGQPGDGDPMNGL